MPGPDQNTPESAAMAGFPPAHVRVVAVAQDGDDAFVVLDTGTPGRPYLYGGTVHRVDGQWTGGIDGNGGAVGWTITDHDRELGVVTIWDEAPPGAVAARVQWRGIVQDVPVHAGGFLAAWWREPWPEAEWPTLVAVHIAGQWVAPPAVQLPRAR
jgi:hypothetical protein